MVRQDYRDDALPEKTKANQVTIWRQRIKDAQKKLLLKGRIESAKDTDSYLSGSRDVPIKGKKTVTARVYLNYMLPLLEELHRTSIPEVPEPNIEARTKASAQMEKEVQQFINLLIDRHTPTLIDEIKAGQWDDDKLGIMVFRCDWAQESVDATVPEISEINTNVQIQRAREENANPDTMVIAGSDYDIVHLAEHEAFLQTLTPDLPEYGELSTHISAHRGRLRTVTFEGPRFRRVRPDWYVYQPEVRYGDRGWEAEKKSVRVRFLKENGYKNVNPQNAPAEHTDESIPYEDKTVLIWEIHDRLNGKEFTISAEGPTEPRGKFLMERPWRYGGLDIYNRWMFHNIKPEESWGEPLGHVLVPILERLAIVDYYIQRHVENHPCPKILGPSGAGSSNIKKGLKDTNQMYIGLPDDLVGRVQIMDPPALAKALLEYRNMLLNELRRAVGLDAQDVGAANPHQISATESSKRTQASGGRVNDRQKTISEILSWAGGMFLKLYRDMGIQAVEIKVQGAEGPEWTLIDPRDLPIDIDIAFDIEAITDQGRAENIARSDRIFQANLSSQVPIDRNKLLVWYNKENGLARPGQFIVEGQQGPENVDNVQGNPGIEGSNQAPVGTTENQQANADFTAADAQL
tara:strand:- start:1376 stop:3274 length:1899 start_codon:yes stop_codon:yes gene_type:complete